MQSDGNGLLGEASIPGCGTALSCSQRNHLASWPSPHIEPGSMRDARPFTSQRCAQCQVILSAAQRKDIVQKIAEWLASRTPVLLLEFLNSKFIIPILENTCDRN